MNGKPGDGALTDIINYRLQVFHPKVDELIRELHSAGALDHPLARAYIDLAFRFWREIACFLSSGSRDSQEAVDDARWTWLRNFAYQLYIVLEEFRGSPEPTKPRLLPDRWDPLVNGPVPDGHTTNGSTRLNGNRGTPTDRPRDAP